MLKKLSKRSGGDEKGAINKLKDAAKKSDIVKELFGKYNVPINEIDKVHIEFNSDLDVSAKTKDKKIYINERFLDDKDESLAYLIHELTHYVQQRTNSLVDDELRKDYLDNEHELEAFRNQIEFKEEEQGEKEAKRYINQVLDHHEVKGRERKEKRDELLSDAMFYFLCLKTAKVQYKEKKLEDSGNVTYIYSSKHIEKRNKEKAKKIEKLKKSISDVRTQVRKDITDENPRVRLPALAVALIDETYERVGNRQSARELKHFGVTEWRVKHVTFSDGVAKIKYVGKSGVKQKKEVREKAVLKALKKACNGKAKGDQILSEDGFSLNDNHVNHYLRPFDITAKDIRGFHANEEMRKQLKKKRKGTLPKDSSEKEKQLKKEFKEALEETSKIVGHEASTLKNQYLVPGLEEKYLKSGNV